MGALHNIWLKTQMELPDEQLMLKSAEGYRPITKQQLLALIASAKPGSRITVNGLTIAVGDDGDSVQLIGTSPEPIQTSSQHEDLNKSASRGRGSAPTFGDCLLYQFRQNERKHKL